MKQPLKDDFYPIHIGEAKNIAHRGLYVVKNNGAGLRNPFYFCALPIMLPPMVELADMHDLKVCGLEKNPRD